LENLEGYEVYTMDQKYERLNEMYENATDVENADKEQDMRLIHPDMLGRIMNSI